MEAELRHQAQEDAQNRRENELNRLALDLGQREAKLLVRKAKHEEEARALKRRREAADNASSAKQKLFCDLGQRRKQQLVTTAIFTLSSLSRGAPEELLAAVTTRITRGEDSKVQLEELRVNVAEFCHIYLQSLPEKSRIAAILSQGLTFKDAHELTGVAPSSISWGLKEVLNNRFSQTCVSFYTLFARNNVDISGCFFAVFHSIHPGSPSKRARLVPHLLGEYSPREVRHGEGEEAGADIRTRLHGG